VRTYETGENQSDNGFSPPRFDLNSPDLYIPTMSFLTYAILVGFNSGLDMAANEGFKPEVLGLTASTAFFVLLIEVMLIKAGCYFLSVQSSVPFLDLIAYCGYKFIPYLLLM
jgi:hypothetical protein